MINKLLLVLLFLLVIPNYSQELIVKNHLQSILVKPNLTKQFYYFEKNDLSDNTQKTKELDNGNLIWITDANVNYRINPLPQRTETRTYQDEVIKEIGKRGRFGGRPKIMDKKKITLAKTLLADKSNSVNEICEILQVSKATLYRCLKKE